MIFFPGLRFYTAGDVNSVRTNDADGRSHVFDLQAASENNTVILCGAPGDVPIRGAARTTILAGIGSVKQESKNVTIFVEGLQGKIRLDAKSFDDWDAASELGDGFGGFVAVKLRRVEL